MIDQQAVHCHGRLRGSGGYVTPTVHAPFDQRGGAILFHSSGTTMMEQVAENTNAWKQF